MRCSEISILLATRRDLSVTQEQAVRAHLDECGCCAALWSREERTSRVLRALPLPQVKQPPEWVEEEIQAMLRRTLSPRRRWRYGLVLGSAALGSLTIFLLLIILSNIAPRLSPLDGTYQPGPLGVFQAGPQLRPAPDPASPSYLYVINESIYGSSSDREKSATVFDPVSGKKLLVLDDVEDVLLAPDGSRLYATVPGFVLALDPQNHRTLWKVALDYDLYVYNGAPIPPPSRFATSPDGRLLYIFSGEDMSQGGYQIRVIDTQTAQLLPESIALPDASSGDECGNPHMLSPSVGDSIYLLCAENLYKANIADGLEKIEIPRYISIETPRQIADAMLSADSRKIYALTHNHDIYAIDPATQAIRQAMVLFPSDYRWRSPGRGRLVISGDGSWLGIGEGDRMLLVDLHTWQIARGVSLPSPLESYMTYMNTDGSRIYTVVRDPKARLVDDPHLNTIVEISTTNGKIMQTSWFRERQFWKLLKVP